MKRKSTIVGVLTVLVAAVAAYAVIRSVTANDQTGNVEHVADGQAEADSGPPNRVVAYYFHTNIRCETCVKIERFTDQAIRQEFADALGNGSLDWRIVNTDKPENKHILEELDEFSKSVVLVGFKDGEQVDHKSLEDVWLLVENPVEFDQYVKREVRAYLDTYAPGDAPA